MTFKKGHFELIEPLGECFNKILKAASIRCTRGLIKSNFKAFKASEAFECLLEDWKV